MKPTTSISLRSIALIENSPTRFPVNLDVAGNRIARKAARRAHKAAGKAKADARAKERAESRRKLNELQEMVAAAFEGEMRQYHTGGYPAHRVWLPDVEIKRGNRML